MAHSPPRPAPPLFRSGILRAALLALLPLFGGSGPMGPLGSAAALGAQQIDSIPGVRLGLTYETSFAPVLAVKPFTGRFGGSGLASEVEAIIARDLEYSDRFEMLSSLPAGITGQPGVDYQLWDQLNVDWLVTGRVEGSGEGYILLLELHDVVYSEVREQIQLSLPRGDHSDFRMAVHRASDQVVEWVFDEPGIAATRIAFSVVDEELNQELWTIDSDGEDLRRITDFNTLTLSPNWSPDGSRMAYVSYRDGTPALYQLDLTTGAEEVVEPGRDGQPITPSYSSDGRYLAFALVGGGRSGIFQYDVARGCCLTHLTGGRWEDLSPTYSPDGRFIAFNSNRLGTASPQVYVMPAGGGEPDLISPYIYGDGGYFTSPEWSPTTNQVAFHGRIDRGRYHILVADMADRGRAITQLTTVGNNEDPSWAPDGRHLVFVGERNYGYGLFVVDTATGRTRMLLGGMRVRIPSWSPALSTGEMALP